MRELPTGTVTFLFSDIEGSTRMLRKLGRDGFGPLQDDHAAVIRAAIARGAGIEIRTEGDAFFAVFPTAAGALAAATQAQRDLAAHPWPDGAAIKVRIGLHTGEGVLGGDDYIGIDVNKAARIAATGHGGQIVLSSTTAALVADDTSVGVGIRDLGTHLLKDFEQPERLHDVVMEGVDGAFPPLRTGDPRRTVLPTPRTSFVGRQQALAEIAASVTANRLTTLTGPGGTGKTRLAIETAGALAHRYADGVFFVDLSAVTEPALIAAETARVLRVKEPNAAPDEALRAHLADRTTLLVLDNLEQLVAGSAVCGDLLDAAPGLTVLATSRIPLRLSGEVVYAVPPLSLPDPGAGPIDELTEVESVRLFVDRARDTAPGFRLDDANAEAVVEIVSRLDALPLAIELATARLRVLDPATLAERLEHRLPMLTGGARDAPERHRTLAASIRWSEESLDEDERRVFRDLSVFAGGWSLDAAEAVCGADDVDVLEGLGSLVDASLVRRSGDGEELRFRMLETIREYAAERFAEADRDEREAVERRHAAWFRALAEDAEPHLTGEHQLEWLARIEREHDNIRAVFDRAERSGSRDDVRDALRIAGAIWRFWQQRGHLAEGRTRLQRLLALPAAAPRDAVRARALGALGSVDYWLTDYATMAGRYEEAFEIATELGDRRLLSRSLLDLSFTWFVSGDINDAIRRLEEVLAVAEDDDVALQAKAHLGIGYTLVFRGDIDGAGEPFERAIALLRTSDERFALYEALSSFATLHWLTGSIDRARDETAEATDLVLASPTPLAFSQIVGLHEIAAVHEGRFRDAAILHGMWERIEDDYEVNFPEVGRAFLGDPAEQIREALGPEGFAEARALGGAMTMDEMIERIRNAGEA